MKLQVEEILYISTGTTRDASGI